MTAALFSISLLALIAIFGWVWCISSAACTSQEHQKYRAQAEGWLLQIDRYREDAENAGKTISRLENDKAAAEDCARREDAKATQYKIHAEDLGKQLNDLRENVRTLAKSAHLL